MVFNRLKFFDFANVEDVGLKLKWFFHKHILSFSYESFEVLKTKVGKF